MATAGVDAHELHHTGTGGARVLGTLHAWWVVIVSSVFLIGLLVVVPNEGGLGGLVTLSAAMSQTRKPVR